MQRVEPHLDLREPARIEFEPLRVVRQRIRGLAQLDFGRIERGQHVVERRVERGQMAHVREHRAQMPEHRLIRFGDRQQRTLHALAEVRRMREAPVLAVDLVPFARLRRELVEFGELPGQFFAFELQFALVGLRELDLVERFAPGAPGACDGGRVGRQASVRVEHLALGVGPHQQLVRVLAVHVDQHLAQLAQLRERGAGAVDERARTAVGVDDAAHHDHVVGIERMHVEPLRDTVVRREFGGDVGALAAGAHDAGV
ncbi:hypothetical protein BGC_64630 [Burkholderia sp. 3C]